MSWWERELPNDKEMEEGLLNLERKNNKDSVESIDLMIDIPKIVW